MYQSSQIKSAKRQNWPHLLAGKVILESEYLNPVKGEEKLERGKPTNEISYSACKNYISNACHE